MKKFLSLLLVFCCIVSITSSAFAEAKISVVQKKLISFEGDWKAFFFAKVENKGDEAASLEYGGKLVAFDSDDNVLLTENYVSSMPIRLHLQPGEYAYLREYILENELKTSSIADYKFSIKTDKYGNEYDKLPCEATVTFNPDDSYNNYVNVTFTNTLDEILYDFYITTALFDQNGELIFVDGDSHSTIGVHPGSTITLKLHIDSDLVTYYARNSLTPTTIDAIVYVEK